MQQRALKGGGFDPTEFVIPGDVPQTEVTGTVIFNDGKKAIVKPNDGSGLLSELYRDSETDEQWAANFGTGVGKIKTLTRLTLEKTQPDPEAEPEPDLDGYGEIRLGVIDYSDDTCAVVYENTVTKSHVSTTPMSKAEAKWLIAQIQAKLAKMGLKEAVVQ